MHKTHYRTIFEETGVTIDHTPNHPEVMKVLTEIVTVLQLLRKLGWGCRDVGIGKLLLCNGRAKLADLGSAEKAGDTKSRDMRTGTMHFMSVEVSAHLFLFLPQAPPEPTVDFEERVRRALAQNSTRKNERALLPFAHIHLHDLESLWWVAVWMVFYNEFCVTQQSNEIAVSDLRSVELELAVARPLFPSVMETMSRRDGFHHLFRNICQGLPSSKHTICSYLDLLRHVLIAHYVTIEATLPHSIDLPASKDFIYDNFREVFTLSQALEFTLAFIPDVHAKLRKNLKR